MTGDYTIRHYPNGIAVFGEIPINDISHLADMGKKSGFDQMHMGIAIAIGATLVMTDKKRGDQWGKEIDEKGNWLTGTDTGVSSRTIWAVMTSNWTAVKGGLSGANAPYDPGDFGRCHRLLKLKPEWRPRLGEVAALVPVWAGLVREWDRLTEIYERDLPTGESKELYQLITALRDEAKAK